MNRIILILAIAGILGVLLAPMEAQSQRYYYRPYFAGSGYAYAYPLLVRYERPIFGNQYPYEFKRRPLSVPDTSRLALPKTQIVYVNSPYSFSPLPYASYYPPPSLSSYGNLEAVSPYRPPISERQIPPSVSPPSPPPRPQEESQSFAEHLTEANRLFKQRDYVNSVPEFRQATNKQPSNAPSQMGFALALFATGDYGAAASTLRQALKLHSAWYDKAVDLSVYYGDLNDFKAHFALLDRYLLKQADNLNVKFLWGYLHFVEGRLQKAADALAQILEKDPNELEATTMLGRLAAKQLEP
ncbi:MAG: tetratricopeptide repeat protein [Candidatus Omnitrophota bacterium]